MLDESHGERIARIDENVKALLLYMPRAQDKLERLELDSAENKVHHKIAIGVIAAVSTPALMWLFKVLGLSTN